MSQGHTQVVNIRNLSTKKVTFYPQNAEVVREIGGLKLRTGFNEISITGITPIADASTIRVEIGGPFSMTDMVVELVDNPENFDDVYPIDLSDSSDDEADAVTEQANPEIESLETEIAELQQECDDFQEVVDSNTSSIKILEATLEKLGFEDLSMVSATLSLYQKQRSGFYAASASARTAKRTFEEKISALKKQKTRLEDRQRTHNLKKKAHQRGISEETRRVDLIERASFWPIKVYRVTLTINSTILSPEPMVATLLLMYIVSGVSWEPSYNVNISSTTRGTLHSQAEVQNTTSETWENAEIILSTAEIPSPASLEFVPTLDSWSLFLTPKTGTLGKASTEEQYATLSYQERANTLATQAELQNGNPKSNGADLSGANGKDIDKSSSFDQESKLLRDYKKARQVFHNEDTAARELRRRNRQALKHEQAVRMSSLSVDASPSRQASGSGLAVVIGKKRSNSVKLTKEDSNTATNAASTTVPPSRVDHASELTTPLSAKTEQSLTDNATAVPVKSANMAAMTKAEDTEEYSSDSKQDVHNGTHKTGDHSEDEDESDSESDTAEPIWRKVHGLRTIEPSSSKKRLGISIEPMEQTPLIHMVIPKLRTEAVLLARITNTTATRFLEGPAMSTLDGKFMGYTRMQRCSVGKSFQMPLGVDPAVQVEYNVLPMVNSSSNTKGAKEPVTTFSRTIVLTNTRPTLARIIVEDQIPVTSDKQLKIQVLEPEGLQAGGASVFVGKRLSEDGATELGTQPDQPWGRASARLDRQGIVYWSVLLQPTKAIRLGLTYTLTHPAGVKVLESVPGQPTAQEVPPMQEGCQAS